MCLLLPEPPPHPLPHPTPQVITGHQAGSLQLSALHTVGCVFQRHSPNRPRRLLPHCVHKSFPSVHLSIPTLQVASTECFNTKNNPIRMCLEKPNILPEKQQILISLRLLVPNDTPTSRVSCAICVAESLHCSPGTIIT